MTSSHRVALIGCGQIADAHLEQIRRIETANLVAVCDVEPVLARQAAERFDVPQWFTSVVEMLRQTQPDIVHVTTPVQTHAELAMGLLEAGVHVYLEKPFAVDVLEARRVIDMARRCRRQVCLGHDQLFDPAWLECREIIASGKLGEVQHVESVLGYPLSGSFGSQVMNDPNHWVRRLPGGLFQNTISHPLYRITELLPDLAPRVAASWFSKSSDTPFPTELRVHLQGERVTGSLLFTSTTQPLHRLVRVYGSKAGIEVNLNSQVIRWDLPEPLPGALGRLVAPVTHAREAVRNFGRSFGKFWRGEFHYFNGMRTLFERFYESTVSSDEPPVSYREALRVTALMDEIFATCRRETVAAVGSSECDAFRTADDALLLLEQAEDLLAESLDEELNDRRSGVSMGSVELGGSAARTAHEPHVELMTHEA